MFGILTNAHEWAFYHFQHGSPDVIIETHLLSVHVGQERDSYADQIKLSTVVGIMSYQMQGGQAGGAVKRGRGQ